MVLLVDIGNTHTRCGLAGPARVRRQMTLPTDHWDDGEGLERWGRFVAGAKIEGCCVSSVVPKQTPKLCRYVQGRWGHDPILLGPSNLAGIGVRYPRPSTIGPDRLANAVAATHHFGAPSIVVDFGTAVTFDVVDRQRNYVGGIIAPGLSAMTDYLHQKTALLPRIKVREPTAVIGKTTRQAMLIGTVVGYRGLVQGLIAELKRELKVQELPVIATGGYAALIASRLPEIRAVEPLLTLEGLRLTWRQFGTHDPTPLG